MSSNRMARVDAGRRAQSVRDGVNAVNDLVETIVEIEERQDWLILGYKSWGDYFEAEFGPNQLKLSPQQRGVIVAVLAASGMSRRKVARWLGVDEKTLRNDAKAAEKSALPAANVQVKDSTGGAPVDGKPGATGFSAGPVEVSRLDGSGTPRTDPGQSASGDSDAAGSAAGAGASAGRPVPAAPNSPAGPLPSSDTTEAHDPIATSGQPEEDHREAAALGDEDGDDAASPSEAQPARSGHVKGADEVEDDEVPPGLADPTDGREQSDSPGVSTPAAPVPVPTWLVAITNVIEAAHELDDEALEAAAYGAYGDLSAELGSSIQLLTKWHRRLLEAK